MKGRPTKPTRLKKITGTLRKGRTRPNEPQPAMLIPDVPPHLSDEAKVEWGRVSQELEKLGLLTRIDRAALAAYCDAWSDFVDASTAVRKIGKVVKNADGTIIPNPYLSIQQRAAELMHKFLVEFGMTPSARRGLK